jgi:hypothetical protein
MATSAQPPAEAPLFAGAAERGLTTPRAAGVAGIVFAVLFTLALLFLRHSMGRGLSTVEVMRDVVGGRSTLALVGLYMIPFAGIAFLWFIGVVRDRVGEREDKFFATVFLGSGLLFIAMVFAGAAALGGLVAGNRFGTASPTDVATVGFARSVGYSFMFVYAAKVAGVFAIATSTILRRTRWPRWTYLSGYLAALILIFSITFFEPVVLIFPAWVAAISLYVLLSDGGASIGRARTGSQTP